MPFLDHELVELAAACPPELKMAQIGKGVLKDVARDLVPDQVIDRPKGYFPVPALTHLRGPHLDLVREALDAPEAKERGLFLGDEVDRLVHRRGRGRGADPPARQQAGPDGVAGAVAAGPRVRP